MFNPVKISRKKQPEKAAGSQKSAQAPGASGYMKKTLLPVRW